MRSGTPPPPAPPTVEPVFRPESLKRRRPPPPFGAFRHRNFRLYFAGHLTSLVGWWMHQVALPWMVLLLTDSPFYVGLVSMLATLPVTLFSLHGGVVADRFPKRAVIIATQCTAMLVALGLAGIVLADAASLVHLMAAATLLGLVAAFDIPGRQAFLVDMVGKPDLMNAIALNSSAFNASRIVGPAIAGLLIGAAGVGICFLLNGLSYLALIIALVAIRVPTMPGSTYPASSWTSITEGLGYIAGNRLVRTLLLMLATTSVFGFPFQVLLPVVARDLLEAGPVAYGWMLSAAGIGALVGGLGLATFGRYIPKGRIIATAAPLFGLLVAVFGVVPSLPTALVVLTLTGFTMLVHTATTNTLLQTLAPDALRGRVMSVYTLAFMGLMPFGALLAGTVAERLGPRVWLVGGGTVCSLFALAALRKTPDLWRTG
jgi:MFS family permease